MTIQSKAAKVGEKELRKNWPVEEGTDFGTTRQTGTRDLTPTEKSLVPKNEKEGLD